MLMDHSKLGRSQLFAFAALDDVGNLIGDGLLPGDFIREALPYKVRVFSLKDGLTAGKWRRILKELFFRRMPEKRIKTEGNDGPCQRSP